MWHTKFFPSSRDTHTHTHRNMLKEPLFLIESVSCMSLSHWRNIAVGWVAPAEKIDVVKNKHDMPAWTPSNTPTEHSFIFWLRVDTLEEHLSLNLSLECFITEKLPPFASDYVLSPLIWCLHLCVFVCGWRSFSTNERRWGGAAGGDANLRFFSFASFIYLRCALYLSLSLSSLAIIRKPLTITRRPLLSRAPAGTKHALRCRASPLRASLLTQICRIPR